MAISSISVCVAVYGTFDRRRLRASIEAMRRQVGVELEVVVAEESPEPTCGDLEGGNIRYVYSQPERARGFNTGKIRNAALTLARYDLLYLTDADIVFLDRAFLARLVERSKGRVLVKPPMIRLLKPDVATFTEDVSRMGIDVALTRLTRHNRYIGTYGSAAPPLKIAHPHGRVTTTDIDSYLKFKSDPALKAYAPVIWSEVVHFGGIFATRKQVSSVGHYCERYETWGHEDTDLQWKLGELYPLEMIPDNPNMLVLHLDHDKEYFSPDAFTRNRSILEARKKAGVQAAIRDDLECQASPADANQLPSDPAVSRLN